MIKNISSGEKNTAPTNESDKPDARNVSNEVAEQFSSLVHKKSTMLKGVSKPQKLNKSLDKIENKLTKQVGQAKATHRQTPVGKNESSVAKQKSDDQEATTRRQTPVGKNESSVAKQKSDDQEATTHRQAPVGKNESSVAKQKSDDQEATTHRQAPVGKNELFTAKQKSDDQEALPQSLDAFDIASLIAQNHAPLQSAPTVAEAAPAPPVDLSKIVGEIADRILVSSPADNPAGMQEIRIHLKESVLPNTEVRIYRHAGSLQVEFLTGSKDSQMFIEQRQPDIQKILGERLANETVNVSVQDSQQTRGGQGEGRSRQQYVTPDLDDDTDRTAD